jgi:hypothetical protein
MDFICEDCGRGFTTKRNLKNHHKKNACKELTNFCKHCGKGYTSESSMYRHIRTNCKVKKKDDEEKKGIYDKLVRLEEENKKVQEKFSKQNVINEQMVRENKQLKKKLATMDKSIINNNTNNGVINNIILVGYGKEDMSKINKDDILKSLKNGFNSTIRLTEEIHFNPKYPEYHNIYISNIKDKYAMMYDGSHWNLKTKEDVINMIYDDKKNYIEENLDDFVESLSDSRRKELQRWIDTNDADPKITRIKEEIKLLLYNKRDIVINTQNDLSKEKPKLIVNLINDTINSKNSKKKIKKNPKD